MDEERAEETARLAKDIVKKLFVDRQYQGVLNVNIPPQGEISLENAEVVPQTVQIYHNVIAEREDIDGSRCYRILGDIDMDSAPDDSDVACIKRKHIALTPLYWRQTAFDKMADVKDIL